ncbi:MAG: hypothetical protein HY741_26725 [Chloroflexi bacterium]|nr:hypothetical protein [Chloroflexota bacterium]
MNSGLDAIAVVAPNDIWAGGRYWQEGQIDGHTLLEHWDGTQWTLVDTPDVGGIDDIFVAAPNDIWALGFAFKPNTQYLLHWDGSTWQKVPLDIYALALGGTSGTDIWALGSPSMIRHWDGASWSPVPGPDPSSIAESISDVKAFTPNDAWAVGHWYFNVTSHGGIILHWDGTAWTYTYRGSGGSLLSVAGTSGKDVWIGGSTQYAHGRLYHWDGQQWRVSRGPQPLRGTVAYTGLAALATDDVWTVGGVQTYPIGQYYALLGHWDGKRWSSVPTPTLSESHNWLAAVAVVNAEDVWAVGAQGEIDAEQTLIMHATRPCYLPPAPKLQQPQNNASILFSPLQLVWKQSATATHYEIQMRRDSTTGPFILRAKTKQRKYLVAERFEDGQYFWRVRGCNGGGCGAWSAYYSFHVHSP